MPTQRLEDAFLELARDRRRRAGRRPRRRRDRAAPHRVRQGGAAHPHARRRRCCSSGLPTLIVVAINARGRRATDDEGEGLFRLAQQSGLLIPAAVLSAMSGFLLVVVAGTFAGDSVASDAAWGNLRYLLHAARAPRPAPRRQGHRRRRADLGVHVPRGAVRRWSAGSSCSVRTPSPCPAPGLLQRLPAASRPTLLVRLLIATAYVAFGFTALLAVGTLFSTLTDTATGAVGATIGVYIVSEILDGITQLGAGPVRLPDALHDRVAVDVHREPLLAGHAGRDRRPARLPRRLRRRSRSSWFRPKDIRS